jgi:hypothetical protein
MENSLPSRSGSNAVTAKPRRRLKPEVAARHMRASADQVSRLYEKPVEQLTPMEIQTMKQAFFRGL